MQPIATHDDEVIYFGCFCFRSELGFLNCDICMRVLFWLPFMLTCSMIRFLSLLPLGLCACVVSLVMWSNLFCLCEVALVPYVDAVVAMTVMRVLLYYSFTRYYFLVYISIIFCKYTTCVLYVYGHLTDLFYDRRSQYRLI